MQTNNWIKFDQHLFSKAGGTGGEEVMYESQMRRIAQIFRIMRILR